MGILVARAYPTSMFAGLADHTYVECLGGGRAWGCWGGKTGGRVIGQGSGFTKRANCIAQENEKAGIRCYLVNGVCHQAANRVLIEAKVTVRLARGYSISSALFGTYGRRGVWPCASPFNRCANVTGDLDACADPPIPMVSTEAALRTAEGSAEAQYIDEVLELYDRDVEKASIAEAVEDADLQVELFMHFARYQLGERFDDDAPALAEIRSSTEDRLQNLQRAFAQQEISARTYVAEFDMLTIDFQDNMSSALSPSDYRALYALQPEDRVSLVDPRIVQAVYGV